MSGRHIYREPNKRAAFAIGGRRKNLPYNPMAKRIALMTEWEGIEIVDFPVALTIGQRLVIDGRGVATVHKTHLCKSREELLAYIERHKDT